MAQSETSLGGSRSATATGAFLALGAAVLWGATGSIQAFLPGGSDPLVVGAARLAIGATGLAFLAAIGARDGGLGLNRLPAGAVFAAGSAIALYNLLFFAGVARAGVGLGTALAIGSGPIWVALWELVALRARPSATRLAAQGLTVAGAAALALAGGFDDAVDPLGMILSLGAGAAYAAYTVATESAGSRAPAATLAAVTFGVAALVAAPAYMVGATAWLADPSAIVLLLFLGLGSTGLAYALYTEALRRIPSSSAVTYALAEPLTAWLLATILLAEPSSWLKIAGAALLFAGLLAISRTTPPAPRRD